MPTLEIDGLRTTVEVLSKDADGYCEVWFPATGNRTARWTVHLHTLTFGPHEQPPAGNFVPAGALTGRHRNVLTALTRAGYHGLSTVEISERCGLDLDDARRTISRLRDRNLIRNNGVSRPAAGRSWAVWEITHHGDHALAKSPP